MTQGGETKDQREVFGRILLALGVAVMLMYLVLVVQFSVMTRHTVSDTNTRQVGRPPSNVGKLHRHGGGRALNEVRHVLRRPHRMLEPLMHPRDALARGARLAYQLFDETLDEYSKDRAEMVAAGLAFYTLLSMAPLIIIAVAIAGAILGEGAARREALRLVNENMGQSAAATVDSWVKQASDSGAMASVIGVLLVLYTASRLGAQLRVGLNQVWNVDPFLAQGFKASIRDYLKRRLFAFLLVVAAGPILLVVFLSRALLSGVQEAVLGETALAGGLVQASQVTFSLVLVAAMSAVVFKVVPDTRVGWAAVLRGGILTSLLFNVGNFVVGLYLGRATVTQTYGAAGSVVVVLLWLYFSAQMFLFGAEFTQVYAQHYGRGLNAREQRELEDAKRGSPARRDAQ